MIDGLACTCGWSLFGNQNLACKRMQRRGIKTSGIGIQHAKQLKNQDFECKT